MQLSLLKKKIRDMVELLGWIKKYINFEETLEFAAGIEPYMVEPDVYRSLKRKMTTI